MENHVFFSRCTGRVRGHSLTNVLMTLAIAGIVSGGTPAMQGLLQEQRLVGQVNQLLGDLNLTRSEAIKRGVQVVLCKSTDGASCSTSASWHDGWLVFADTDEDETVDTGEAVIRVSQALTGAVTLRFGETGSYRYVRYAPDGSAWPKRHLHFLRCTRRQPCAGDYSCQHRPRPDLGQIIE